MPRRKSAGTLSPQISFLEPLKTAPCVPAVRQAVEAWRKGGYKGATETTRILLAYWFQTDHRLPNRQRFRYHAAQQEAVETLIYLYEVAKVRRRRDLLNEYAPTLSLALPQHDEFVRYATKMATGSGKTKVIALAFAWQYLVAANEGRDEFAKTALLIAPNVIVLERLATDFAQGRIFHTDPIVPPELKTLWDVDCYVRGEPERASSVGALYVTNIQQLYDRPDKTDDAEPDAMLAVMGGKPKPTSSQPDDFPGRIASRGGPILVLNDEAHHTHDEASEWNESIRRLGEATPGGVAAQLDFSATPRHSKGTLFSWVVSDYPLKQAILDGLVKRPMKGIATGIQELPSAHASTRYQAYLTAAVERWREYREALGPLHKKPILFVMLNSTDEADDVGDYLKTRYPDEFGGDRLLVIHTNRQGDVSVKDESTARKVAREVDRETSPVNAIVSVLMLREGWDVQNVTVILGLRPFTAKANILPEQTIGRGLRLMFRSSGDRPEYVERVDVIGNKAFLDFVAELEKEEDLDLGTFELGKDKLVFRAVHPDPEKMAFDIRVPQLSPLLQRKRSLADEIAALDVMALSSPIVPRKPDDAAARRFQYDGVDLLSLEKLIEREYEIPETQNASEVVGYYARRIAQDVKLPSQFAALVPKVREFLAFKAFGDTVDLDDPAIVKAVSSKVCQHVTVKVLGNALRSVAVEAMSPELVDQGRPLSSTRPFPTSRVVLEAKKTVFNLVACDNQFERRFAQFLDAAPDVARFAKLPEAFGFTIEYSDAAANLRLYEPDFVAVASDGGHYLIETKGLEDVNVAHKDRAALLWCENTTLLTGVTWRYLKVPQKEFDAFQPLELSDLAFLGVSGID